MPTFSDVTASAQLLLYSVLSASGYSGICKFAYKILVPLYVVIARGVVALYYYIYVILTRSAMKIDPALAQLRTFNNIMIASTSAKYSTIYGYALRRCLAKSQVV